MAALPAGLAPAPSSSRRRRSKPAAATRSPIARVLDGLVAVACLAGAIFLATGYPIEPALAIGLVVAWAAFAAWRFDDALTAVIALVPVVGLATWTGWLTFEEVDLLVLASATGGYGARVLARPADPPSDGPRLSLATVALLGLFLLSTAISLERGVAAAGGWHFGFFDGYDGALNSVRIFKSFALALLVTPLVVDVLRRGGGDAGRHVALDRIGLGLAIALALGALAVLQERFAFTGLMDFSDDYRVTGLFWEMHVGGAALDGFLALTIPFAVREVVRNAHPVRFFGALVTLGLAGYACLVTFSRGVYVAVPVALLVLAILLARQRFTLDRGATWRLIGKGVAMTALVTVGSAVVFRHGGYRAILAALAVLALAIVGESSLRRSRPAGWISAAIAALIATAIGYAVAATVPKGFYLVFVVAFAATAAAIVQDERRPTSARATRLVAAWLWLAASAVQVAGFWGGTTARDDSLVVALLIVVATLAASRLGRPVWPVRHRERVATIGFVALVIGSVAVFSGGAYMGGRFDSSRSDLAGRMAHWTNGVNSLRGTDWLFGKGLGRFPATSGLEVLDGTVPGRYHVTQRAGETFMTLLAPHIRYLGFDEMFRVSQRVTLEPHTLYNAVARVRTVAGASLHLEVCEKQLLYSTNCKVADVDVPDTQGQWKDVPWRFDSGDIGAPRWFGRRPAFFAVALGNPDQALDIRSIRLLGRGGADALVNGDFHDRTARWFTQSDKYHLPWHIKNIVLDVLFDQGWVGLAAFALLVAAAFLRTALGRARHHPDAPFVAASITGFLAVGAFDSLLDVPRVAWLFWIVVIIGLALRSPRVSRTTATPATPVVVDPPPAAADEAAARALRRRRAFGERRTTG